MQRPATLSISGGHPYRQYPNLKQGPRPVACAATSGATSSHELLTSSSRVWIQPRSRSMRRRERMWRRAAATIPGTPATVSRNTIRSSHLPAPLISEPKTLTWR